MTEENTLISEIFALADGLPLPAGQLLVVAILLAMLAGFAFTHIRHDVVALSGLLACVLTGLTPAESAFEGFGHPAVITVAAVLMISAGMKRAGVIDLIASRIEPFTESLLSHMAVLVGTVTVASAFMNNVGALALMMPVAIATARSRGRPPAMFLMPLAFGSLLGGMSTLIGTPPNIIIANLRRETGAEPFSMFDFTPVGLSIVGIGLVYLILAGWRLVPHRREGQDAQETVFARQDFVVELHVPEGSDFRGLSCREIQRQLAGETKILGVVRGGEAFAPRTIREVGQDDILLARVDHETLERLIADGHVELAQDAEPHALGDYDWSDAELCEFLVPTDSVAAGWLVSRLDKLAGPEAAVVALAHQGRKVPGRLGALVLEAGDVILMQGDSETMDTISDRFGLIALVRRDTSLGSRRHLAGSVGIFATAILATSAGMLSAPVAFMTAVLGLLAIGTLRLSTLYSAIDWPLIVLLGALFPLGRALEETGLAGEIAALTVATGGDLPLWALIAITIVVTMFLSDLINNAATALVMAPIAMQLAATLSVSADPFLMAVAVGASSAFLTPIGHQSNTLVFSRGGYRFGDYWRVGLPLEALIVLVATPMILIVWPA